MEYYIYHIPLFLVNSVDETIDIPSFCEDVEELIRPELLQNVEAVYVGEFKNLNNRNAAYSDGAIYMTCHEPTNFDMVENFIHEVAHSLEPKYGWAIYDQNLIDEFRGKRTRLYHLLNSAGFHINQSHYSFLEYSEKFDDFLANVVGYPTLLSLTMGLFASPYGATSIREYFANGFEKYLLGNPKTVRDVSPVLHRKIEEIINDDEA